MRLDRSSPPVVVCVALLAACATKPRFDGPAQNRNQHPAQLVVARMVPRSAAVEPAGGARVEWRNSYSSLFLGKTSNGATFATDGEYLRTALATRVGVGGGFDVGVEVPFAHASGGFLDSFLIDWHAALGLPDQGRTGAPNDRYRIEGSSGGQTSYEVDAHGFQLMDVPITLSWSPVQITPDRPFGLLLRGGAELPTGNDDRGYGSGGVDWTVGAVGEWRTGFVAWNAHVEHTWTSTPGPTERAGYEFADVTSLGLGGEGALSDAWSLLVQVEMDQSTLRTLDLPQTSLDQWTLWTGLRVRLSDRVRLEGGVGEDLTQRIAPDFTAWLNLAVDLGPR